MTTDTATLARIKTIHAKAIIMPFQFLSFGFAATNSCKTRKKRKLESDIKVLSAIIYFGLKS